MTLLIPLGLTGVHYVGPISLVIIVLLTIVYLSYRQTIAAYPGGGGSYTVARENLGSTPDYSRPRPSWSTTFSSSPSASPRAWAPSSRRCPACSRTRSHSASASSPSSRSSTCAACGNRGWRSCCRPTCSSCACSRARASGCVSAWLAGGHPVASRRAAGRYRRPIDGGRSLAAAARLRLRVHGDDRRGGRQQWRHRVSRAGRPQRAPHADGDHRHPGRACSPASPISRRAYGIAATDAGRPGYQSVLSQLVAAVVGRGPFYYVTIASILPVLALSANTGFADFPRLCRLLAQDGFLPRVFASRGRRLVYSLRHLRP